MHSVDELIKATGGTLVAGRRGMRTGPIRIDSRTLRRGESFLAVRGEKFDGHDFIPQAVALGCSCVIAQMPALSKAARAGVPEGVSLIAVDDTVQALGRIARSHRRLHRAPVVAVTGSNGKTTAKEMISWVLGAQFNVLKTEGTKNNHIGLPLTLLNLAPAHEIAVVELGTNHFGEIPYLASICEPDVAVITNIGPSHLEHFGDVEGVCREKLSLLSSLRKPGLGILNADDPLLCRLLAGKKTPPFLMGFGMKNLADFFASDINYRRGSMSFCVNNRHEASVRTAGFHNIYNALISAAVARSFGMAWEKIALRLASFTFPAGRFKLCQCSGVQFIDDTYNSNPLSLGQALNAFNNLQVQGRKIVVMGDMLELGERAEAFHSQMGEKAASFADAIITVGELSRSAGTAARASGFPPAKIFSCDSPDQARKFLFSSLVPTTKDMVLVKGSRSMKMERVFQAPPVKG